MDLIHKSVHVFLYAYTITSLYDFDTGELSEFLELKKRVERGKWITSTPAWIELLESKEYWGSK